jgi:hypothetical protein
MVSLFRVGPPHSTQLDALWGLCCGQLKAVLIFIYQFNNEEEKLTEIKILAKITVLIFVYNFNEEKWKIN